MRYLKPHGALYHRVIDDAEQAAAVLAGSGDAAGARDAGRALHPGCRGRPRRSCWRGSPTAATAADGRLVPRSEPGAVLDDAAEIAARGRAARPPRGRRCACTATTRARSRTPATYGGRWRPPAGRCGGSEVRVREVGPRALLVEVGDAARALDLATWARADGLAAEEVVPAARTVLFDGVADPAAPPGVPVRLDARRGARRAASWSRCRSTYDGPDLAFVAEAVGDGTWRRPSRRHAAARVRRGVLRLRARLRLPVRACRRSAPCRGWITAPPGAGRVGGAGRAAGAGSTRPPRRAAGGCIGTHRRRRCGTRRASEPALLAPGTRVRFVPR